MFGNPRAWGAALLALALSGVGVAGVVRAATTSDFAVTAAPTVVTASQGGNAAFTVTASTADGFSGIVVLSVAGAPAGVSVPVPPAGITLGPNATGTASLAVSVGAGAVPGSYPLVVTGTSGALSHSVTVTLRVRGVSVSVTPTSRTIVAGQSTSYSAVLTATGFTGSVVVTTSGLPLGATGPAPLVRTFTTGGATSISVTLAVATASTLAVGPYPFTVEVAGVGTQASASAALVVASPSITVTAAPTSRVVVPGAQATYALSLVRFGVTGGITMITTGLPSGAVASFNPAVVPVSTSTLTVSTTGVPVGRYPFVVRATRGAVVGSASLTLVVEAPGVPFTIAGPSGPVDQVSPGISAALNLTITNPNVSPLNVTNLTVGVTGTDKAGCGAANYSVTQFSGSYPIVVPAGATASLQDLGVPRAVWPKLTMLNLSVNQDACKGARIDLTYSGTGNGGETT